jgi:hypothetical protein
LLLEVIAAQTELEWVLQCLQSLLLLLETGRFLLCHKLHQWFSATDNVCSHFSDPLFPDFRNCYCAWSDQWYLLLSASSKWLQPAQLKPQQGKLMRSCQTNTFFHVSLGDIHDS